tara:strand:+ start:291 stop:566 length:276 start_codon:yes stop_codon:yes gene_type:complete
VLITDTRAIDTSEFVCTPSVGVWFTGSTCPLNTKSKDWVSAFFRVFTDIARTGLRWRGGGQEAMLVGDYRRVSAIDGPTDREVVAAPALFH